MSNKAVWEDLWKNNSYADWDEDAQVVYDVLLNELNHFENKKILEAGSGTGRISLRLAKEGADVTLVDYSETAIQQARERFLSHSVTASFVCDDIMNMAAIPDSSFDVVWNSGVLEHFREEQQVLILKELKRVLRSDGILITLNPNMKCQPYILGKWFMESSKTWPYGVEYPVNSLLNVCDEAGLKLFREYSVGFLHSLNFLARIPQSEMVVKAFQKWFATLNANQAKYYEGYLLVSVCRLAYSVANQENEGKGKEEIYSNSDCKITFIILGSIDYLNDLWQRPQHLASQFTHKGYRVIYVNNNSKRLSIQIKDDLSEIAKDAVQRTRFISMLRRDVFPKALLNASVVDGVTIVEQLANVEDEMGHNADIQEVFLDYALNFFSTDRTIVLSYLPEYHKILSRYKSINKNIKIFYDCVDDLAGFHSTKRVINDEYELINLVDGVIVTSKTLYVHKSKINERCILVPNGASPEHFAVPKAKPLDISSLEGPIIGYVGAISYWFDQRLVYTIAQDHPEWNIVLVGTIYTDISLLRNCSNIVILGKREYADIPAYIQHFDVGIIPFLMTDLIVNCNPIKYYEYISSGVKVVSVPMPELIGEPNVYLAKDTSEFEYYINKALEDGPVQVKKEYLDSISLSNRADLIENFIINNQYTSRSSALRKIADCYERYQDNSVICILLADIYNEIGKRGKAHRLLTSISTQNLPYCQQMQLRLYLDKHDVKSIIRTLINLYGPEIQYDIDYWLNRGFLYLKTLVLRKVGRFWDLPSYYSRLTQDNYINEEIGNLLFDTEEYEDAETHYSRVFNEFGKLFTIEASLNFAQLKFRLGQKELAKDIISSHTKKVNANNAWKEIIRQIQNG